MSLFYCSLCGLLLSELKSGLRFCLHCDPNIRESVVP